MNKNELLEYLQSGLIERGIDPATAARHVANFGTTLTEADEKEINAIENLSDLAEVIDGMADNLKQRAQLKKPAPPPQQNRTAADNDKSGDMMTADTAVIDVYTPPPAQVRITPPEPQNTRLSDDRVQHTQDFAVPAQKNTQTGNATNQPTVYNYDDEDDYEEEKPKAPVSTKGKLIFWGAVVLTLPLTAGIFLGVSGIFFGVIAAFGASIAGLMAGLIGMVAAGSAVSLVGIIYGITQLFVTFPIGLYEIGLGVIITGFIMFAGLLIYNFAIRLLPFLIKHIFRLYKRIAGKMIDLFNYIKGECYRLEL
jgi:Na+/melibiose symporter and related transporters